MPAMPFNGMCPQIHTSHRHRRAQRCSPVWRCNMLCRQKAWPRAQPRAGARLLILPEAASNSEARDVAKATAASCGAVKLGPGRTTKGLRAVLPWPLCLHCTRSPGIARGPNWPLCLSSHQPWRRVLPSVPAPEESIGARGPFLFSLFSRPWPTVAFVDSWGKKKNQKMICRL